MQVSPTIHWRGYGYEKFGTYMLEYQNQLLKLVLGKKKSWVTNTVSTRVKADPLTIY